jgi:hypothetical protein
MTPGLELEDVGRWVETGKPSITALANLLQVRATKACMRKAGRRPAAGHYPALRIVHAAVKAQHE